MLTNECGGALGCKEPTTFELISPEGDVLGGLCETHGLAEQAKSYTGYRIIRAGWEKEQEPPELPTLPAPGPLLAPPNAVYDEEESLEDNNQEDSYMPEEVLANTQQNIQTDKQIPPTAEEASTNFFWRIGKEQVFDMQTTVRGVPTEWGMKEHLRAVIGTIKAVVSLGGVSKNTVAFAAPAPVTFATPVATTTATPSALTPTPTPTAATPVPTGPVPVSVPATMPAQAGGGKPIQVTLITHMEIQPQANGQIQLGFYAPGYQYPYLYFKRTPEEIMQFLAPLIQTDGWTPEHLTKMGKYEVKYNVTWQESEKLNKKNNPYKNVISVAKA